VCVLWCVSACVVYVSSNICGCVAYVCADCVCVCCDFILYVVC